MGNRLRWSLILQVPLQERGSPASRGLDAPPDAEHVAGEVIRSRVVLDVLDGGGRNGCRPPGGPETGSKARHEAIDVGEQPGSDDQQYRGHQEQGDGELNLRSGPGGVLLDAPPLHSA